MITGANMALQVFAENKAFADSGTIIEVTGNNDGPELDRIQSVWGLKDEPYCAMGAYWAFAKTYCEVNGITFTEQTAPMVFAAVKNRIAQEWLRFDPLVANIQAMNKATGNWRDYQQSSDVRRFAHGDYILFTFPTGHHIGQFDRVDNDGKIWLVEWNSTASNAVGGNSNDPGDGGGCYYKWRMPSSYIWGWIPWTYGK